tara:strand:- start:266 stop:1012 length:747 start_codon:yes stop_codon:yes gene_type:complete
MSKVLVRKQLFDPKQTANNMAAVNDLSSGGAIEQIGLLNLLGGEKLIAPVAAEKLGYGMDSDEYKRLKTGENIGRGLAGAYGGFRTLDALASGRSPTSAIGAGAGAYGSVSPIARNIGVRAAGRRMKPAAPPVAVVKPSPLEVKEHENLQDVNGMTQMVFDPKYAGPAQPARPTIAGPTPEDKAEGYFEDEQIPVLAQQGNKSGNVAVTQPQSKGKSPTEEQMKRLMQTTIDEFLDSEAKQSGAVQGA